MTIIFPVYILSTVENSSTRKILDPLDFVSFGFNGLWHIGYLYIPFRWRKGKFELNIYLLFFCAVATRIWTSAYMGIYA